MLRMRPTSPQLARECARIGEWMLHDASLDDRLAGSVPFCTMCAVATAGWQLLRQLRAVEAGRSAGAGGDQAGRRVRFFLELHRSGGVGPRRIGQGRRGIALYA